MAIHAITHQKKSAAGAARVPAACAGTLVPALARRGTRGRATRHLDGAQDPGEPASARGTAASRAAATPTQTPLSPLTVTFSHKRNKKLQQPNLQWKRIYWPEEQRWVRLRVCARALKTVEKNGLAAVAKEHGVDLRALPYVDARPARVDWLAAQDVVPPQSKKVVGSSRKMKNEAKLAASAKAPLVARYVLGGPRVMLTRDPALVADVKVRGAVAP